jgi:hypothetical protein
MPNEPAAQLRTKRRARSVPVGAIREATTRIRQTRIRSAIELSMKNKGFLKEILKKIIRK